MASGLILCFDPNAPRRALICDCLRAESFEVQEVSSESTTLSTIQQSRPDILLLALESNPQFFHKVQSIGELLNPLIVPIVDDTLQPGVRGQILKLNADAFLNADLPRDELAAAIRVLIRQKCLIDELKRAPLASGGENSPPLRERLPQLYQAVLARYEQAVKQVLEHRIYKISDDVFAPFRQIAKELFLANATARDAVELHYHTLRKIAPSPEAPRAQAYLEVGRTTIVGLMGDLLSYYREAGRAQSFNDENFSKSAEETLTEARVK